MKRTVISLFVVVMSFTLWVSNYAQEEEVKSADITTRKMRLLILPSDSDDLEPFYLEREVTSAITDIAIKLGRFEVIDRNGLQKILAEQALQQSGVVNDSMIVKFGQIAAARDALSVSVLDFSQNYIPVSDKDEDDEAEDNGGCTKNCFGSIFIGLIKILLSDDDEIEEKQEGGGIETLLSVQVRKIDIETGLALQSFNIDVRGTGSSHEASKTNAMSMLRKKAMTELKKLYLLTSEVISADKSELLLFLGADIGVRKGTVFEILEPEKKKVFHKKEITVPGKSAGLVSVTAISGESNRSKIIRQWSPIKPGYRALEHTESIVAFQVYSFTPFTNAYFNLGLQLNALPVNKFDCGGGLRYIMVTDSYGDKDHGGGLGIFGSYRFLNDSKLKLSGKLGLDLDLVFKTDDKSNIVSTFIFSAPVGLSAELYLSAKTDLVFDAGYRLGGMTDNWNYTEEKKSKPAIWKNDAPEVDNSGFYFSVGLKFYTF